MSSFKDIHVGTGRNFTIATNEDLIIESRNIYLGKPFKYQERQEGQEGQVEGESRDMEPMVLGKQLLDVLNDLINCLSTACYITPAGAPAPIIDTTSAALSNKDNPAMGRKSLSSIQDDLQKILSYYHYIEPNADVTKDKVPE